MSALRSPSLSHNLALDSKQAVPSRPSAVAPTHPQTISRVQYLEEVVPNFLEKGAVPKKEKACRNLLLTGFCKDENTGCEYNHDIVGITRMDPPGAAQTNTSKPPATVSPPVASSSTPLSVPTQASPKKPGTPGTSPLAQSLQARSVLPVSAPAFVPAAVAAAQRAALNAWGGITPGKGGGGEGAGPGGGAKWY